MPLNTVVEAEPESLHAFTMYLRDQGGQISNVAVNTSTARGQATDWSGQAGDAFMEAAYDLYEDGNRLKTAYFDMQDVLERFTADIIVVHRRMGDARDVAVKGGLMVTASEIHDPGPPPPQPEPVIIPSDGGTAGGHSAQLQRDAAAALGEWSTKAAAYAQATAMVGEARKIEHDAETRVLDAVTGVVGNPLVFSGNLLTGVAAGFLARQTALRTRAASFTDMAKAFRHGADDVTRGSAAQAKSLTQSLLADARASADEAAANTSKIGSYLEKLPPRAQRALTATLGKSFPTGRPFISKAPAVFKRIPGLGAAFSTGAVVADATNGKDVGRSVVSNGSGLLAGAGVGLLVGGPLGALGGAIVGTGASWIGGEAYDVVTGKNLDEHTIAPSREDMGYPSNSSTGQGPM